MPEVSAAAPRKFCDISKPRIDGASLLRCLPNTAPVEGQPLGWLLVRQSRVECLQELSRSALEAASLVDKFAQRRPKAGVVKHVHNCRCLGTMNAAINVPDFQNAPSQAVTHVAKSAILGDRSSRTWGNWRRPSERPVRRAANIRGRASSKSLQRTDSVRRSVSAMWSSLTIRALSAKSPRTATLSMLVRINAVMLQTPSPRRQSRGRVWRSLGQ